MERLGGEDAASRGVGASTWEHAALALLIYQPQWFTVIDVHIPECQNNLCFKRNQWLRLWFYLRPFPDKWLNCAWSWENTAEKNGSVLTSVCVERLGKDTFVWGWPSPRECHSLCEEHHSSVSSRKTQVWRQLCFGASSEHFCPALMWEHGLQCWTAQF